MRVSYEKLIIREERAQIGQVALMKLAFLLSKSQNLKTYTQLFEEEGCTCNLSLKRRWLNKWKDYPFELENTAKTGFFLESIFERDVLKI